jgi:ribose transport system substrate-binding protein
MAGVIYSAASLGGGEAMNLETRLRDPYLVKSVLHSSQLLGAFRVSGEALPLREISKRSSLPKTMAFRLLYTLEKCGMVEKVGENLYRSCLRPFKQRLYRLGYCAQGTEYGFSKEVSASLRRAADAEGIELLCLDNQYNPKTAQRTPIYWCAKKSTS